MTIFFHIKIFLVDFTLMLRNKYLHKKIKNIIIKEFKTSVVLRFALNSLQKKRILSGHSESNALKREIFNILTPILCSKMV